jgi:chromosome segregation ATPase
MKITKNQLKQIIKEELSVVMEDKQQHMLGISKKIERLKTEIERAEEALESMEDGAKMPGAREEEIHYNLMDIRTRPEYYETQTRISNMNSKIDLLIKQAAELSQDSPGQLTRPDEV